jgi:ankyrin repeat protein
LDVVQCLLEQGADKDKAASGGWTPLYIAACKGHLGVVEALLLAGADMTRKVSGATLLGVARRYEIRQAITDEARRREMRASEQGGDDGSGRKQG